jgi:hypothetical protein
MSRPRTLGDQAKRAGARGLTRAYQEILGRAPDKGGFKHYQQQMREGRSIGDIRKEMAGSPEYKSRFGDGRDGARVPNSGPPSNDRGGAGFPRMPQIILPGINDNQKRMAPRPGRGSGGGSYASGPGLDRPGTGSTLVDQGLMSLTELGNKYSDNEMIGGLVTGTYADIARTQANTGLAIQYNDAMYESMGRYQGNLENLRTANTSKLMAQEGAITGGLMDKQGKLQQEGLRVAGDEQRKGIRETGEQQRLGIRETGYQDRMGVRERTQAQKNLRADARGAIRRSGARFFG